MKWSSLVALVLSTLLASRALATDVGGPIVTDTTWTLSGSPYVVIAAVIVGGNATLTIEPGVVVKVNAGLGITVGSQAFGVGTLKAIGTAGQRITFTSNILPGQPGQWKDLQFTDRTVDAVFDGDGRYVSGSVLQYCVVEFAGGGAPGSGAVTISQSSPFVNFCEIRNNARSGIYANNVSATPLTPVLQIIGSHVHHNADSEGGGVRVRVNAFVCRNNVIANNAAGGGGGGLYADYPYGDGTTFTFSNNTVSNNTANVGGGVYIRMLTGPAYLVSGNTIVGNSSNLGGGMYAASDGLASFTIQNNNIIGNLAENGGGLVFNRSTNATLQATLTGNTVANNQARGTGSASGHGGGIYVADNQTNCCSGFITVNLVSNNITHNEAAGGPTGGNGFGGGIYVREENPVTATTINLAGDQATDAFNVLSGNTADFGDAIYNNMLFAKNGSNDIHAEYVCWGGLDPNPTVNPNLIYDFFDDAQKSFVIYPPHVTGPNCIPSPGCGPGLIADCNGNCAPVSWLTDGLCDNGFYTYNGVPIFFNCQQFGNDSGDCDAPPPPIRNPPNRGTVVPPPQYDPPPPPPPQQNKLILVTHGWNTSDETYAAFWAPLRNVIAAEVGSDWKVASYNWAADSRTGILDGGPDLALANALYHGARLGREIGQQGYQHVHLIGHSCGSALIAMAAARIKHFSPGTTIHTTYLDAFAGTFIIAGVGNFEQAYGGNADWSDHYFTKEPLVPCGPFTRLRLPSSHNFDISRLNPGSELNCISSHTWPRCFYRYTVDGNAVGGCGVPSDGTQGYGFPLSYEQVGGDVAAWISSMEAAYPRDGLHILDVDYVVRNDPPFDLNLTPSFRNSLEAVQIIDGVLTMTSQAPGEPEQAPAWINFEVTTTLPINFIECDMEFLSAAGAAGLLTVHVDGTKCGTVDEPYTLPGSAPYRFPTPGDLAPGQHIVSFRLDSHADVASTVRIANVASGLGEFVASCRADFNNDGQADFFDYLDFAQAFSEDDAAADFDGNGQVDFFDYLDFVAAFDTGCE
jgi:hypothetical protein